MVLGCHFFFFLMSDTDWLPELASLGQQVSKVMGGKQGAMARTQAAQLSLPPQRATSPGEAGEANGENTATAEQTWCLEHLIKWKAGLQSDFYVCLFQALKSQHLSAVWWRVDCVSPGSKIPGWWPGCPDNLTHPSARSARWARATPNHTCCQRRLVVPPGCPCGPPRAAHTSFLPQSAMMHLGICQAVKNHPRAETVPAGWWSALAD